MNLSTTTYKKECAYIYQFSLIQSGLFLIFCLKEVDESIEIIFIQNFQECGNFVLDVQTFEFIVVNVEIRYHAVQPLQPGGLFLEVGLEVVAVLQYELVLGGEEAGVRLMSRHVSQRFY